MKKGLRPRRGKLIVIDGSDGSGKTTQWNLLQVKLKKEKIPYTIFDFPVYQSFFGKFIKKYLQGEFGDPIKINSYYASLPYALDRFFCKNKIEKALKNGRIVLVNRYVPSNEIYQGAKFKNKKEQEKYWQWVSRLEYQELKVPKPDLVLYLYVPVEISWKLLKEREKNDKSRKIDKHEDSLIFQKRIIKTSKILCQKYRDWKLINCVREGGLLSKREIHKKVWRIIEKII